MSESNLSEIQSGTTPPLQLPSAADCPIGRELLDGFLLREECVQELIGRQALQQPNALAIASSGQTISYGELEEVSNRLAHRLLSLGVSQRVVVGLCVDRSPAMAECALAILKTGAAYLPMDPSYPAQRLRYMLKDAGISTVLAQENVASQLTGDRWQVLDVNRELSALGDYPPDPVRCKVRPEDSAYVIYTSGSTGNPKGVEVTHRNLLNLVSWHQHTFELTADDRATLLSSPGFDAAVWELWPYLAAGAGIHIPSDSTRFSPEKLRDWLVQNQITISFAPTPVAERLIAVKWPPTSALRILLTGGDALQKYPRPDLPFVLVNNYGPTECTVVATSAIISPDDRPSPMPPIGRPISNVQVHILDENLRPVVKGEAGEICIGGAGVSRGYLNHPELTSGKFVPDLFSALPGARLYKTGDRARFLPDGQIEFLGRMDDQIKIRGFRIEPNEIARALSLHLAVGSSVVNARENSSGEKELVAYIVPNQGHELSERSLREHVRGHVPEYMVPTVFVRLDSLPLTASGKPDRRALPSPDNSNTIKDDAYKPAGSPVEAQLAAIVCKLLGLERVGTTDNFFLIGGHSLLGTQLIAYIREAFGVDLALRTLFDSPTIAGIAVEIEKTTPKTNPPMPETMAVR